MKLPPSYPRVSIDAHEIGALSVLEEGWDADLDYGLSVTMQCLEISE
jgi:hypothetical protein